MTRRPHKPDSHELGLRGEHAAAAWMRSIGFRVLARNLRTRTGEIDLLVQKRRLLVAVEVKTRSLDPAPEWSLKSPQLARLRRTLIALAGSVRRPPDALRIDVVAVRPTNADTGLEVQHFEGDEFRPKAPGFHR